MTGAIRAEPGAAQGVVHGVEDEDAPRRRRARLWLYFGRIVLLAVVFGAWQFFGPRLGQIVASSPVHVFESLRSLAASGALWQDLAATMEEVVVGYLIGVGAGVVLGALMASSDYLAGLLDPFIIGLYGIPKIALGPLLVVWFGINLAPKVALAAIMTFFLVFFSTYQGMRDVDPATMNAVRLMGASPLQVRRYVIFPGARSSIFLGLKLGVPEALVGAIVGEFISSSRGIGYEIQYATAQLDTAGVFAGLVVLTILSLILNALVNRVSGKGGGFR
ncbi:MAG: ABC transporter permease [Acetobacteraceae bacterium]